MNPAVKAASEQHIATIEAERNQRIPAVRRDLASVFAPVRKAIADGSAVSATAHHAVAALRGEKENLALAVAKAYEDAARPMMLHTLTALAWHKAIPEDKVEPAYTHAVNRYVARLLPDYTDQVIASFAAHAAHIAAKAKARPVAIMPSMPVEPPRGGRRVYYAKATRWSTHRISSHKDTGDDTEVGDDEEGDNTEADLLDELDGLVGDSLDMIAEMVSVTAGNLGMFATADAWSSESGIDLVKVWQAIEDNRTRPSHADADGQAQNLEDPFDVGDSQLLFPLDSSLGADIGEIIYCFPGDTPVVAEDVEALYRRWYIGELVELTFLDGSTLRSTPNHPILTPLGWKKAGSFNAGDYVSGNLIGDGVYVTPADLNVTDTPATFAQVYEAAAQLSIPKWMMGMPADFHGDGMDSQVEQILFDRMLQRGYVSQADQLYSQIEFQLPDVVSVPAGRSGTSGELVRTGSRPASGGASCGGASTTLLGGHLLSRDRIGFADGPDINAVAPKPIVDSQVSNAVAGGDRLGTFATKIPLDQCVAAVRRFEWSGHVYNLQTASGQYGVLPHTRSVPHSSYKWLATAHNCRCVVVFEPAYNKARRDAARQWSERMLRIVHDHGRISR